MESVSKAPTRRYGEICIGIDQSYKRTGISVSADGKLLRVTSVDLSRLKSKTEKRRKLKAVLERCIPAVSEKADSTIILIERVRTFSDGFLSTPYVKSMGALNAVVVDVAFDLGIEVMNVDTRAWKAAVIGTSKPEQNRYGVPDKKWPTVRWCCSKGFRKQLMHEVKGRRQKGTFVRNGIKYEFDDDAADSAAISMFWFIGDRSKLKLES